MKTWLKWIGSILLGLIVLVFIAMMELQDLAKPEQVAAEAAVKVEQDAQRKRENEEREKARLEREKEREAERVAAEERRVTMAEYNAIKTGMTWDEVVEIVGQPTEELSRNAIAGVETAMYHWVNEGFFAGNMNVMFQNGRVVQKAQFGLK